MAASQAITMAAQPRSAAFVACSTRRSALRPAAPLRLQPCPQLAHQQQSRQAVKPLQAVELAMLADLDIDWSDPDTQIGALGAFLGLALGIGAPAFYASRDARDEARLEELRALNRATKEETGEYMSQEEINAIRPARWTDRREFVDDD